MLARLVVDRRTRAPSLQPWNTMKREERSECGGIVVVNSQQEQFRAELKTMLQPRRLSLPMAEMFRGSDGGRLQA